MVIEQSQSDSQKRRVTQSYTGRVSYGCSSLDDVLGPTSCDIVKVLISLIYPWTLNCLLDSLQNSMIRQSYNNQIYRPKLIVSYILVKCIHVQEIATINIGQIPTLYIHPTIHPSIRPSVCPSFPTDRLTTQYQTWLTEWSRISSTHCLRSLSSRLFPGHLDQIAYACSVSPYPTKLITSVLTILDQNDRRFNGLKWKSHLVYSLV